MAQHTHPAKQNAKRIAIVHDFLLYYGGAESVLYDLTRIFPDAPVYTLLHDKESMGDFLADRMIHTSFLQKWPRWIRKRYRYLLPFFGTAMETFDLRDYDLILSSSGAWGKGVVTRLDTTHIAYIHSPMRYVWDENEKYVRKIRGKKHSFCLRILLSYLRLWDHQAAQRPDILLANSQYTQKRIAKYYRRESKVVYPAVNISEEQKPIAQTDYFCVVSRLSQYKNVALAIDVCNKLHIPLVVVGTGREEDALRAQAGETITFTGWVDDAQKMGIIAGARALLFPSEEDFGIVPIEALCVGTPVIALGRGGAQETIRGGVTGELFAVPTVEVMADAVRRFMEKEGTYDTEAMQKDGAFYTRERFAQEIHNAINSVQK